MMNLISRILFVLTAFASGGDMSPESYFNSWEASGADGMFFALPDGDCLMFAKNEGAALHEMGHCADYKRGYPSQSSEFEQVVMDYLISCTQNPCWRINLFYEQGQLDEVYAILYMWDILYSIPQEFEVFYAR